MVAWALSFPKCFLMQLEFPKGNAMPHFMHPCERFLHYEAAAVSIAGAFILPGRYVSSASEVSQDYTCVSERGNTGWSQSVFQRSVLFPLGTNLRRSSLSLRR